MLLIAVKVVLVAVAAAEAELEGLHAEAAALDAEMLAFATDREDDGRIGD